MFAIGVLLANDVVFEFFASFWPTHGDLWPSVNDVTKYVMSKTMTMNKTDWKNCVFLKSVDDIKNLKNSEGSDIQVHGSGNLTQTLLKYDLVDELWLKTFPIMLGPGKKLWGDGVIPGALTLTDSLVAPNGVIFANYTRSGEVKTGTVGA